MLDGFVNEDLESLREQIRLLLIYLMFWLLSLNYCFDYYCLIIVLIIILINVNVFYILYILLINLISVIIYSFYFVNFIITIYFGLRYIICFYLVTYLYIFCFFMY